MDTKRKNIVFVLMLFLLTFGSFFCGNATASAEVNDKKIEFRDDGYRVDGKLYHYRYVTKDLEAIHSIIYRTIAFVVEKKPTHGKPTGYKNRAQVLPLDSKHCYVDSESKNGYVYSYYYWTDAQMNAAFKAAGVSAKSLQASGGNVYFNAVFNVYYRSGSNYTYRSGPHYSQAAIRSAEGN